MGPVTSESFSSQLKRGRSNRRRLVIFLSLAVIVALGVVSILSKKSTPTGVATSFINDIAKDQAQQSYQLTSQNFRSGTTLQQWQSYVSGLSQEYVGSPSLKSISGGTATNDSPELDYTEGGRTSSHTLGIDMSYSDGKWQIDYVSFT
jgi:hypothetical protein